MIREAKRYRGKVMNISLDPEVEVNFDEWVYGGLIYDEEDEEFNIVLLDDDGIPQVYLPQQETIGKSTLQKDKEGNSIFEGDILFSQDMLGVMSNYYIVVDDNGDLGVVALEVYKDDNWYFNTISVNSMLGHEIITSSKLVGNIVDTPEWVAKEEGEF